MSEHPCEYEGPERRTRCTFAEAAAEKAVKNTFAIMGVDVDSPKEVESFRKGLRWGENMHRFTSKGAMATAVILAGMLVTAFVTGVGVKLAELMRKML